MSPLILENGINDTNGVTYQHNEKDIDTYDVVIVGGGIAGIGAAIGAKQASPSSTVLIVESEGCLGGAATHRGVLSFAGLYSVEDEPRRAVGAIWSEIHQRLVEERAAAAIPDRIVAYVQVGCEEIAHN
jgi:glycine/D-amino acid oxidase-like deaminating enzyme